MKRIFLYSELNIFNILFFILFSFFGFTIFYLKIQNVLKNKSLVIFLNRINVKWINFNDFIFDHQDYYNKNFNDGPKISKLIVSNIWTKNLQKKFKSKNNLSLAILDKVYTDLTISNQLVCYAEHLSKKQSTSKITVFLNFNPTNYYLKKIKSKLDGKIRIRFFINIFSIFTFVFVSLKFIVKNLNIFSKKPVTRKKDQFTSDVKDMRIIYFPNKGSFNDNVDKRYLYSTKYKFLKPANILHAELYKSDKRFLLDETLKYYKEEKINNIFWDNYNKKFSIKNIIETLKNISGNLIKFNILNIILISKITYKLNYHLEIFKKFNNLKILLLGHPDIFPNIICVAARLQNIKTISFQTRLVSAAMFLKTKCLDQFYCSGKISTLNLQKRFDKKMKLKKAFAIFHQKNIIERKKISKLIKYCLITPAGLTSNWYDSGVTPHGTDRNVQEFLEKIYFIIRSHKKINFIIKFKSDSWKKNAKVKKIVLKLSRFRNVKILYGFILQKNILNKIDLVVGQPNSLMESCLSSNIPILAYEGIKGWSKWIGCFDKDMLSNKKTLEKQFDNIINNFNQFNSKIIKIKKIIFFEYSEKKFNLIKKDINTLCQR